MPQQVIKFWMVYAPQKGKPHISKGGQSHWLVELCAFFYFFLVFLFCKNTIELCVCVWGRLVETNGINWIPQCIVAIYKWPTPSQPQWLVKRFSTHNNKVIVLFFLFAKRPKVGWNVANGRYTGCVLWDCNLIKLDFKVSRHWNHFSQHHFYWRVCIVIMSMIDNMRTNCAYVNRNVYGSPH